MRKKLPHTILAEGEATGHAHRATGGVLFADGDALLMEVADEATITHEEHHSQTIPPSPTGDYQIGGVMEQDHFDQEARRVRD